MPAPRPVLVLCRLRPSALAALAARFRLLYLHASPLLPRRRGCGRRPPARHRRACRQRRRPRRRGVPGRRPVAPLRRHRQRGPQPHRPPRVRAPRRRRHQRRRDILRRRRRLRRGPPHRRAPPVIAPSGAEASPSSSPSAPGSAGSGSASSASAIARRLEAFGCVVTYHSRRQKHGVSYGYHPTALDLAASSDVLVVACALTAETRHVVDRAVLDALGNGGVVVNVARGENVDEAELVRALAEGRLAGAGLEVFEDEPNVPAELLGMDNVVLTHHQAVFTPESMDDLDRLVLGNLEAFFAGAPLLTPVVISD